MNAMSRRTPRNSRDRATADFLELSKRVKASGLLERRYGWYAARATILTLGLALTSTLLLWLGRTPWQLLNAAAFALIFAQVAFFGHDAAHHQVFASG